MGQGPSEDSIYVLRIEKRKEKQTWIKTRLVSLYFIVRFFLTIYSTLYLVCCCF